MVFLALVLLSTTLFAAPITVNWVWTLDDPGITTFRYQLNGEEADKWTVVDSSVTSHNFEIPDSSQTYTLYIQQSYNGIDFSESGQSVIGPELLALDQLAINWVWELKDPMVTTVRYQLDGEEDDKWTVADSSVTQFKSTISDTSKPYALYLQQSYDGINFSESGKATIDPKFLFSEPVLLTWNWTSSDPLVTNFRYQVDGEEEDKWTVVDSSVTEYSFESLDSFRAHTLYLQQSYDGVTFSSSGKSVIDPVALAKGLAYTPDAEAAPVADAPEKVKAESRFKRTITIGGDVVYMDAAYASPMSLHRYNLEAELALRLKNMVTFNKTFGLGMDMGLTYTPYIIPTYGYRQAAKDLFKDPAAFWNGINHTVKASVAPMLNIQLGKLDADIGGGAFITWGPDFNSTKGKEFMYGAYAKLALAYQFNPLFSMGMNVKYNYILSDLDTIGKFVEAGAFLGFSF